MNGCPLYAVAALALLPVLAWAQLSEGPVTGIDGGNLQITGNEDDWDAVAIDMSGVLSYTNGRHYMVVPTPRFEFAASYGFDPLSQILTVAPLPNGHTSDGEESLTFYESYRYRSGKFTITLDIEPVDEPPHREDARTITGNEDDWDAVAMDLREAFPDLDGAITYAAASDPTVLESATYDVDHSTGVLTITPLQDGHTGPGATEAITVTGTAGGMSATYAVTLDIEPVDDPPTASPKTSTIKASEGSWESQSERLYNIFKDVDGKITYAASSDPASLASATYELRNHDSWYPELLIHPKLHGLNETVNEAITVTGTSSGRSATYTVELEIRPAGKGIPANHGTIVLPHVIGDEDDFDVPAPIDLQELFGDVDGVLEYRVSDQGAPFSWKTERPLSVVEYEIGGNNMLTMSMVEDANTGPDTVYWHPDDYPRPSTNLDRGMETLRIEAIGPNGRIYRNAEMTFDIEPVNDPPVIADGITAPQRVRGDEGKFEVPGPIDITAVFADVDRDRLDYAVSPASGDSQITVVEYKVNSSNFLIMERVEDASTGTGTESLTVTAADPDGESASYTITFDIEPAEGVPAGTVPFDAGPGLDAHFEEAGISHKFDAGFEEKILGLMEEGPGEDGEYRHYGVVATVYGSANKAAVVHILEGLGASSVLPASSLSFVSASVPIDRIHDLASHDEVYLVGDGEVYVYCDCVCCGCGDPEVCEINKKMNPGSYGEPPPPLWTPNGVSPEPAACAGELTSIVSPSGRQACVSEAAAGVLEGRGYSRPPG